ncbi:MAG: histidinol-phosphate transaminase [Clostridia bacterium]|nr:histidinol-phosphate transaminase [Clostridia bacterium]
MSRFLNENLRTFKSYTPGEQPRDKKYIKLNTNESPYPPSPEVIQAVSANEVSDLRLYSDPTCKVLKEKLAKRYDVNPKNVFVSNGSDESLNFFFMAFCSKENKVIFPEISYGFYKVFCELYGISYEQIPLCDDFSINVNDYIDVKKHIVIANPNAPTGLTLSTDEIEKIVKSNPDNLVLIDEAYVDFGGVSVIPLTKKYDNLVVVQTFSKSRSLAGARLGYAIGNKEIIEDLEKIKYSTNPYNINRLTLVAGAAAIDSDSYFMDNCEKIKKTREYTEQELKKLGFYSIPSSANFIFAKSDKISGEDLYLKLKEKGILVRHFSNPKICEYNRITVGSREQMETLIKALEEILEENNADSRNKA